MMEIILSYEECCNWDAICEYFSRSMFLAAPHKRKAESASLDDDDVLASIMKAKGLDGDDDDIPVTLTGTAKRQKSEVI